MVVCVVVGVDVVVVGLVVGVVVGVLKWVDVVEDDIVPVDVKVSPRVVNVAAIADVLAVS